MRGICGLIRQYARNLTKNFKVLINYIIIWLRALKSAAWLSEVRVVRCAVNSVNERNLGLILLSCFHKS
jgi:hypothetical protein